MKAKGRGIVPRPFVGYFEISGSLTKGFEPSSTGPRGNRLWGFFILGKRTCNKRRYYTGKELNQDKRRVACNRLRVLRKDLPDQVFESWVSDKYDPILDGFKEELAGCRIKPSEFQLMSHSELPRDPDCNTYEKIYENERECDPDLVVNRIDEALRILGCSAGNRKIGFTN